MVQKPRVDANVADRKLHLLQLPDFDSPGEISPTHRKERQFHLGGENGGEPVARALIAEDLDRILGLVSREKKRQTLDVVPVRMGKEQMQINRRAPELLVQRKTEFADAGAGVENDDVAIRAHFDAGRIAAVTDGRRSRNGNRSPDTPEFYSSRWRMKFQTARLTPGKSSRPAPRAL